MEVGTCLLPLSMLCSPVSVTQDIAKCCMENPKSRLPSLIVRVTLGRSHPFSESLFLEAAGREIPAEACRKESEKETVAFNACFSLFS